MSCGWSVTVAVAGFFLRRLARLRFGLAGSSGATAAVTAALAAGSGADFSGLAADASGAAGLAAALGVTAGFDFGCDDAGAGG